MRNCCYLRGQLFLKSPDHPCPAVPLPALTAVICWWLSLELCDVGLGVSSIKKSLKLRESMVGSTLLAKGASGNYSIHHNYTDRTLPHRGQGTQIPSWPHWTRLWAYREGRKGWIKRLKPTEWRKEGGWERSIKRLEEEGKEEGFGTKKEGRRKS